MNITLLGHYDIASLYALDRVIGLLPGHNFSVLLSGALQVSGTDNGKLADLAKADADLCERFLAGVIRGPVSEQLTAPPATLDKPNSPAGLRALNDLQPDLIVSIRYRRILREDAISIPKLGVINLHSGILPDYRGVMATFWAMLAGEKEIGTTLHWIVDSGIDTGPILEIGKRTTRPGRSYLANVLGLYAGGCEAIAVAIRTLAAGGSLPQQRQMSEGRYFSTPGNDDIRRFESTELVLFNGDERAEICEST